MKKMMLLVVVVIATLSCKKNATNLVEVSDSKMVSNSTAKGLKVNVSNSSVNWKGFKPSGEHYGTISTFEGVIKLEEGNLVGGSFSFDMNSIKDLDMPADNEYNAKLVGHLKSADFFDVEKFPTAKFEITSVNKVADKLNISGNLTIKETTKNITISASLISNGGTTTLKSEVFTIDRTDFDVRYGSKKFFDNLKDKFINDEFEMSFEVVVSE